jgi:cytochrome P450
MPSSYLSDSPTGDTMKLLSETGLLVVAGSDTTSIILSALFFSLSRSERIYNKLVREIRTTFKSVDEIRSGTTLYACQYLRACVDEAMRFSPTGGSEMPREAGPGGVTVNGEVRIIRASRYYPYFSCVLRLKSCRTSPIHDNSDPNATYFSSFQKALVSR